MKRLLADWLKEPVYHLSRHNCLTVGDCVEGISIIGATGSGKTSSSGRAIAVQMLRKGFGGLVLTAKADDLDTWLGYFREAARDPQFDPDYQGDPAHYDPLQSGKLVVVGTKTLYKFNPIDYEFRLAVDDAAATASSRLVSLFMSALGSGDGRGAGTDPFWADALRELIAHAVDLALFAQATVSTQGKLLLPTTPPSLQQLQDIIRSGPQSPEEARSQRWQDSDALCPCFLRAAYQNFSAAQAGHVPRQEELLGDLQDTFQFWLKGFPGLAERTRSVVVSSFTAKASGLLRAPLRSLLCSEGEEACHPDATPAATFHGQVVLINLPVKSFGEVGAFAQKLIKTVWQHATESNLRRVDQPCYPVFLWADEAQHFLTPEDVLYQCTARSKLASTVYLSQNLPNYHAQLGLHSSSATDALLGSLNVKIFHCNGEPTTNEWAERIFGTEESEEPQKTETDSHMGNSGGSTSRTKVWRRIPYVPAYLFSELHRGGRPMGRSEAYLFMAGKSWKSCRRCDEQLTHKVVTQVMSGRGVKHLFLQYGDRQHCQPGKEDCCAVCVSQTP
ncbi:type IV secretory system conjugative DNA transfer family protein [Bythopirellula goksoeyrii]|uniref:AAA-like domain protein n=1 Tax=Bythopirellula goksoeyrii TaxID=1400387 RepID=A0A5B9QEY4_9BACT|nr:hypothetical protein [Bythopirellula goksoeyrii]QEG36165.1 hypothetical protein Pr1d_34740 [Bythopirellula goksoeyrii]